jgi:hypothetical protein
LIAVKLLSRWPCLGRSIKSIAYVLLTVHSALTLTALSKEIPPKSAELQIIEKALFLLPGSLRRILSRNQEPLEVGIASNSMESFLSPKGRDHLERKFVERLQSIADSLRVRPKFSEIAKDFGAVARMVLYLNLPAGDGITKDEVDLILRYLVQNSSCFRLVVYDVSSSDGAEAPFQVIKEIRLRREYLSARLREAYPRRLAEYSAIETNPRSPLFGVSSLVYSHSINDLAKVWLWAWKSANGDVAENRAIQDNQPR